MVKIKSSYSLRLDYSKNVNLEKVVDIKTIARYLYDGSYAKPGTNHFLKGHTYQDIEKFKIIRGKVSNIKNIENRIRFNIRKILSENKRISLLLTSGMDSYLIYLIIKSETKNFSTNNDISLVTGRFKEPYDEYSVLKEKRPDINIDSNCSQIESPDEALYLLKAAINAANQPVNGLVASAVYKAIMIAVKNRSVPILGTGETIFFTSTFDFIKKVNSSLTRNYAADKTIQTTGDFLTNKGLDLAMESQLVALEHGDNIFEYKNMMEKFIHDQQFFIDAPRVDYEVSSYCNYFCTSAYTPLRDPKLLELFLNLPKNLQHDGRPKTVIRNLISSLEDRTDYSAGLRMTSPQREFFRNNYQNGGFSDLVEYFISNSLLVDLDLVCKKKIQASYQNYINDFDKSKVEGNFALLSSYNIWKFFITELWLNQKIGINIDFRSIV